MDRSPHAHILVAQCFPFNSKAVIVFSARSYGERDIS